MVNGETAAIKSISPQVNPGSDGLYSVDLEATVDLEQSSWLAARVAVLRLPHAGAVADAAFDSLRPSFGVSGAEVGGVIAVMAGKWLRS